MPWVGQPVSAAHGRRLADRIQRFRALTKKWAAGALDVLRGIPSTARKAHAHPFPTQLRPSQAPGEDVSATGGGFHFFLSRPCFNSSCEIAQLTPFSGISTFALQRIAFSKSFRKFSSPQF